MLELPQGMRELLVERLDDLISELTDTSDMEAIAASIVSAITASAEDAEYDKSDELIAKMESSGELDASLVEVLEELLSVEDEFDFTGEELVSKLEKLCEVEWADLEDEGDDDIDDFFDDDEPEDDY